MTGPKKSLNLGADPYLRKQAAKIPLIQRFFDVYDKLDDEQKAYVEGDIVALMDGPNTQPWAVGKCGAIDLYMKTADFLATKCGEDRIGIRFAHDLEDGKWPENKRSIYLPETAG